MDCAFVQTLYTTNLRSQFTNGKKQNIIHVHTCKINYFEVFQIFFYLNIGETPKCQIQWNGILEVPK